MIGKVIAWSIAAVVLFVLVIATGVFRSGSDASPSSTVSAVGRAGSRPRVPDLHPARSIDPREQRLAELRSKRESIEISLHIEMETGRKLASDADDLSHQSIVNPDERQWLMEKMDKQQKLIDDLGKQLRDVDAQIAQVQPEPVGPPISEFEIKALTQQRAYSVELLNTVESILNARSFAAKAEIYCRFSTAQAEVLTTGGVTGDQIEQRYAELLRAEPTTQQGELQRRQQLSALEQFVVTHRRNLSQCQGAAAMGMEKIPPEDELRVKADQARRMIGQIDKVLASGISPMGHAAPTASPDTAPGPPDSIDAPQ